MHRERQTILSLLALGRITPHEAERLLAASNAPRDETLVIAAVIVAGLLQGLPPLTRLAQTIMPAIHRALAIVTAGF